MKIKQFIIIAMTIMILSLFINEAYSGLDTAQQTELFCKKFNKNKNDPKYTEKEKIEYINNMIKDYDIIDQDLYDYANKYIIFLKNKNMAPSSWEPRVIALLGAASTSKSYFESNKREGSIKEEASKIEKKLTDINEFESKLDMEWETLLKYLKTKYNFGKSSKF